MFSGLSEERMAHLYNKDLGDNLVLERERRSLWHHWIVTSPLEAMLDSR